MHSDWHRASHQYIVIHYDTGSQDMTTPKASSNIILRHSHLWMFAQSFPAQSLKGTNLATHEGNTKVSVYHRRVLRLSQHLQNYCPNISAHYLASFGKKDRSTRYLSGLFLSINTVMSLSGI